MFPNWLIGNQGFPDTGDQFHDAGLSGLASHDFLRSRSQRVTAFNFLNQAMSAKLVEGIAQFRPIGNRAVGQVSGGHNLGQFGRPPFGGKRKRHLEKCVDIAY